MAGPTPTEAPEKIAEVAPNPAGDAQALPHAFTADQAGTLRQTMKSAEQQAQTAAAQHLSPLEIHATADKTNQTVHVEEKRDGKVVETDDIYKDGSKVQHKFDAKGNDTSTQTDKTGKVIAGEVKDADGNVVRQSQRYQDTIVTTDGKGHELSKAKDLPDGGKSIETNDAHGNHVTAQYDKSGHLTHSETKDAGGHLIRTEDHAKNGTAHIEMMDKAGHVVKTEDYEPYNGHVHSEYKDAQGHVTAYQDVDKNGNSHIERRDADGRIVGKEESDKYGHRTVTTYDKQGNETANSYEKGKLTSVEKKDASGHIVMDEYFNYDGGKTFTHYDSQNRKTSQDIQDAHGNKTSRTTFDTQGREKDSALIKDGKTYSDTKTVYNDKTGQKTETHTGEEGFVDSVRITKKDETYEEYGYNKDKEQVYYEPGSGEKGGYSYSRHYQTDPEYKRRPMS